MDQEITFISDELVQIEVSHKVSQHLSSTIDSRTYYPQYSESDAYTLFTEAELRPIQRWTDNTSRYSLWLLERPPFTFPLLSSPSMRAGIRDVVLNNRVYSSSPFGIPSTQDWETLWSLWDLITLGMIPSTMHHQKPIDLRHICLFYLGHIPTFLDIHLSNLLQEPHTEPEAFKVCF
jgi:hypothetical protein